MINEEAKGCYTRLNRTNAEAVYEAILDAIPRTDPADDRVTGLTLVGSEPSVVETTAGTFDLDAGDGVVAAAAEAARDLLNGKDDVDPCDDIAEMKLRADETLEIHYYHFPDLHNDD